MMTKSAAQKLPQLDKIRLTLCISAKEVFFLIPVRREPVRKWMESSPANKEVFLKFQPFNSLGRTPNFRLKATVKCCGFLYPAKEAISAMDDR